jgi:putative heme-binding domain-containing protein
MKRLLLALLFALPGVPLLAADALDFQKGDHVCIVGNTLGERMQHHGHLEARLHSRFGDKQLVVRNLAFSADELNVRLRSANFGSPDQWLAFNKADVIFAFFGYNESFAGEEGLKKFQTELDAYLKHLLAQKYNGKSAPRVVLFSPIAHEKLDDPNLPDPAANNRRLKLYTEAMAEVAKANPVAFVDLFTPSAELYESDSRPLTINGIHLTEYGDERMAAVIEDLLFPNGPKLKRDAAQLEKLRQAVNDKSFHWYQRYRTTDGFSIYGGRADEPRNGLANRPVMAREMEILDVMTANRDQRVWNLAQGQDKPVDDSNTPPYIPVKTNRPGPNPDGTFNFFGGEEAIKKMTVGKGLSVNLFASEEKFPELINPVQMAIDARGRVWVAAWPTYPHWTPKQTMNDKLLILEDTDGDGKADVCKTFAGDLHNPTGFEFYNGGVLVAMAPDLLFLKDTDGDDKYDVRERVLHGLDTADTHHTANSFTLDPGGAFYFQEGTFHHTQVESPWGAARRVANGAVFRYEPRAQKFDVYVSHGFANPHGHVFDRWGQDIVIDGTGAVPYHGTLFSGHIEHPNKHNHPPTVYPQRTRPCSGLEILTSRHFPEEFQGNLLVPNVIGFQGILRYQLLDKDSSLGAKELEPIVSSSDENFRPTDLEVGADGAIYFSDWQNPIIGHLQHNMRDPNRDKIHGRVYRVTHVGRELSKPIKIVGEPIAKLLDLLKEPEDRLRHRAKLELSSRPSADVIAAVEKWSAALDKNDAQYEHHVLESLWMHQQHNVVNVKLLERVLKSPDFHARAAAVRVLCYWRDRVPNALALLTAAADDQEGRVRLEAVRAASFFTQPEAIEVVLVAETHPVDTYIDYLAKETRRTLDPIWKDVIAKNGTVNVTTDAGAKFFLRNMTLEQLLKLERSRSVYSELLLRPGLRDELRREAITGLAKLEKKGELDVLLSAIRGIDSSESAEEGVAFELMRLLGARGASDLTAARQELERLATKARRPIIRQFAFAAMVGADGSADKAWAIATRTAGSLRDFVSAVPMITDVEQRAALYPKLEPLLDGLPENLAAGNKAKGAFGRFVRIELPRPGTLTLAEVEVISEGRNVARAGKATQKNTAHSGDAARALDGNKSGDYNDGGQTHTEENTPNPWWEVDLGEEHPVDSIAIYNRAGELGSRLQGFTLKVLDGSRTEVFKQENVAAPKPSSQFDLGGGGPAALVRRAAMTALVSIRGQEMLTFRKLAAFVKKDEDRLAAIRALQRIAQVDWPKDEAQPLAAALIAQVKKIPPAERTSPAALDAQQLAEALTALVPADDAKALRAQLREIGVRIIRVGTLPERMAYDQEVLVVQAGKPVEFLFDNIDLMPHNFVVLRPGALVEVGEKAEATAQDPASPARQYVPPSDKVLLASRLLAPRDAQKLSWNAPAEVGVYPYVCTFPGHWRRMHGAMYVVEDLDSYLADPEGYLAAAKIVAKDELLKDRRPRTEWKFEELATAVEHLEPGRSFTAGKQMFTVATCIACHKMEGAGNNFGPDLSKLDAKLQSVDILKHVIDPSATVNEKFQTVIFEMKSGKVVTGLVLEESPTEVKIIENPLTKAAPTTLLKAEIETRAKSPVSQMPKGLLDKLSREEIFDLIAYLTARGDKQHALFDSSGHGHHKH